MVKQGYKQTEIGVIPEDWEYDFAGPYLDFLTGFPFKSDEFSNYGTKLLRGSNVKRNEIVWNEDLNRYWESIDHSLIKYLLKEGDIVISMDGSLVGRSFGQITNSDLPCLLVQRVARLRGVKIHTNYLKQYYCSDFFTSHCDNNKTSSAIPHISPKDILEFKIAFPKSLAEQEAIAEALSDADAWIESLEQLIAKKHLIKQGAMQELLTPKEDWEVKKFDKIFIRIASKKYQINSNEYNEIGRYPIIDQGQQKIVGYSDREDKVFDLKNIIIFGDHTRIIKYVDFPFIVGADGVQLLSSQNENVKFLYYLLSSYDIPNTGYNRHFKYLKDFDYFIPSLPEQERIATILSDMDAELEALEKQLGKARQIKQGMMQELLTGRIRL